MLPPRNDAAAIIPHKIKRDKKWKMSVVDAVYELVLRSEEVRSKMSRNATRVELRQKIDRRRTSQTEQNTYRKSGQHMSQTEVTRNEEKTCLILKIT